MLQESIDFHEGVLGIMDESIQVYSPELLQNRISILRDTAVLLDKVGQTEAAIDYATGAMVNAQVRRIRALPSHPPCLPCLACPRAQLRCGVEAGRRPRPRIRNSSGKQT
jgi:hypothetical protein